MHNLKIELELAVKVCALLPHMCVMIMDARQIEIEFPI